MTFTSNLKTSGASLNEFQSPKESVSTVKLSRSGFYSGIPNRDWLC
jgi:hypothetical protein